MTDPFSAYGWTAVPRNVSALLNGKRNVAEPKPMIVDEIALPDTGLTQKVLAYAQQELREETFNHSMRVYYYGKLCSILQSLSMLWSNDELKSITSPSGQAILKQQFPDWQLDDETFLLTCLLHDIGTTEKNISATLMSFEFYGGMLAHSLLHNDLDAPRPQTEAVIEAIIRHQDIGTSGKITTLGQLIQLATIFGT